MKILVSGSRGLVGSSLVPFLQSKGHEVVRLVRGEPRAGEIVWHPAKREIESSQLDGFDAVVHLAGDNIASGRWTAAKKAAIRESRVNGTKFLCETLASLKKPPEVIVSGSAIGYYGDRGNEALTESSTSGTGFLAEVCREWEAAATPARDAGIRVAYLRTGVVLSRKGGALAKMLPPFQLGLGGRLGSGTQYMSWVTLDDLCGIILHIISHREIQGPVNAVAPHAVTNQEFTVAFGHAIGRPTIFPAPAFAVHLLLGEMADELLLSGQLVKPEKLLETGYNFQHPAVEQALKHAVSAS
jgi:hypothetical protein